MEPATIAPPQEEVVRSRLLAFVLVGIAPSARSADDAWAKVRDKATPLEGLSAFLERYVGACADPFSRAECLSNAKRAREEMEGKLYYLILDDRAASMIRPAAFDIRESQYRLDLTPYFEAGGRALTDGVPRSQDDQGRPRMPLTPIWAKLPLGSTPMDLERLFRTGNVKVHLVFKPFGVWKMARKDNKKESIEGVKAKFVAVRLTDARSGDEIALRIKE